MKLDWEPSVYKTKAQAAKALYKALCKKCEEYGQDPTWEVWIKNPEESAGDGLGHTWHVCWESGPYNWGCYLFAGGKWGHVETYWGFDAAFYD